MGNRIKLPNFDYVKVGDTIGQASKAAVKFVADYKPAFYIGVLTFVSLDNIRVRSCRKKDQKTFEDSMIKQQAVMRMHEAEINVLQSESEEYKKSTQEYKEKLTFWSKLSMT